MSTTQGPGATIRELRTLAGMTLKEVADTAGTSVSYLSRVETGEANPSLAYLGNIAAQIASRLSDKKSPANERLSA